MDIRQFRTELAEAFKAAGFERKKIKGSAATIWLLPGREIDREFWEDAIRRPWGFQLSGTLSIDVRAFRDWLTERFPRDQHGIFWSSLTSRHIANERDMLFGAERREPPYQDWVDVIRRRLAVLPDTIEGLLGAERENPEGLKYVWNEHLSRKAWKYFEAWATGNEPRNPPPHRLPTGQIVDAAVNDPG